MNESILCMNGTLQTVYDQQNEINRLKHVLNSIQGISTVDSAKAITGKYLTTYIIMNV